MSLSQISFAVFSTFVIWKNDKLRVVIDLRKINIRLYSNAYSLLRQDIILETLSEAMIFSSVNLIKSFFQQNIRSQDWWKIILITSHRDQEWLTVFIMRLINTLKFFQHRMKELFDFYFWQFVLVYIDDVIIYSQILNQHVKHLNQMLTILENSEMILTLFKCHFAYFSIKVLNHHVSRLRLSTMKKKIETIRKMKFLKNLRKLKIELNFFDYYRTFVNHYVVIARSLMRLKIKDFKNSSIKRRSRKEHAIRMRFREKWKTRQEQFKDIKLDVDEVCYEVWKLLKKVLCETSILTHFDFSKFFILYVDESKEKNYETAIHQINRNEKKRSILFLSRDLNDAKIWYWATELKADAFV